MRSLEVLIALVDQYPFPCLALVTAAWVTIWIGSDGVAVVIAAIRGGSKK